MSKPPSPPTSKKEDSPSGVVEVVKPDFRTPKAVYNHLFPPPAPPSSPSQQWINPRSVLPLFLPPPLECEKCKESFRTRLSYTQHFVTEHKSGLESIQKLTPVCRKCHQRFANVFLCEIHELNCYNGVCYCNICKSVCYGIEDYIIHSLAHIPISKQEAAAISNEKVIQLSISKINDAVSADEGSSSAFSRFPLGPDFTK